VGFHGTRGFDGGTHPLKSPRQWQSRDPVSTSVPAALDFERELTCPGDCCH
jgi:hypothetical protein